PIPSTIDMTRSLLFAVGADMGSIFPETREPPARELSDSRLDAHSIRGSSGAVSGSPRGCES
ncbi:MAG: hypothetical protein WBZ00_03295, partial [Solirubrobacterales bacterium]